MSVPVGGTQGAHQAPPVVVLDTNALLDWCVFKDPVAHPLVAALQAGQMRWLACEAMRAEWHQVWPRSCFARWQPNADITQRVHDHAEMVPEPPRGPLRCRDPDDQVFIDLALHVGARWLFTKDADLLKLARRARQRGVLVLSLQQWCDLGSPLLPAPPDLPTPAAP